MLYIVGTPIGNLKDTTLRALEVLKEVDLIVCEDMRRTLKLLNHYQIKKPLMSYHEHNKYKQLNKIIKFLKEEKNIALVSDAGLPCISDPGYLIVKRSIEENLPFTIIPGPFAGVLGLIISGLPSDRFVFEGFLPYKKSKRRRRLEGLKKEERTIIIYESPHKIIKLLDSILEVLGERKIVLVRELTKAYEEVLRGKVSEIKKILEERKKIKGEFIVLVSKDED